MKNLEVNKKLLQSLAKKGSSLVLVSSLLLATPNVLPVSNNYVYASSSEELENLTVKVGINLYLNDKGFIPKDVNGNETYPFILNGTTYVPIRAIAELFNANIGWNESSNTVSINTTGESAKLTHTPRITQALTDYNIGAKKGTKLVINGVEVIPKDANGNIKDIYVANGTTYVPVRAVSGALGLPITWSDKTNSVFIGNHKTGGITVENIDDIYNFNVIASKTNKCGRLLGTRTPDGQYFVDTTFNYSKFVLALLNKEYYSDEFYKGIFYDHPFNLDWTGSSENYIDDGSLEDSRIMKCFYNLKYYGLQYATCMEYGEDSFDWNAGVINQNYAEFLDKYQKAVYKCVNNSQISEQKKMLNDYMAGADSEVYYGCNIMLDYLIIAAAIHTSDGATKPYDFDSDEYYYLYERFELVEAKLLEEHQRIYDAVFSNTLTK